MAPRAFAFAFTFAATILASTACASPVARAPLDWMSGCWAHEHGDTKEVWSEPEGELMFGYGVSKRDDRVVFFEELRIEEREDGAVYIASPNGGPSTEFTETERTGLSIVFENPDHDFPQRIEYGANRIALVAKIAKLDGSGLQTFSMDRCKDDGESE
ncbi:DUF6265 family protein [Henriciella sp. AS95]|uniref:DUF6265 family protein n=1 Tax=Henriciella sp. AS95 TaxID=3135782 RepID=UPI00317952BA